MPGADFYRALATARFMKEELLQERDAHNAMKLCFEKIHKSLDMYQGHYINRLRFHLNRHHTEYLRKVRSMRKDRETQRMAEDDEEEGLRLGASTSRRSMRVGVAQDLANEVKQLRTAIRRKDLEIERLAMLIDERTDIAITVAAVPTTTTSKKFVRVDKLLNPYLPSSDEDSSPPLPKNTPNPVPARI
jgi:hypothetical protein